MPSAERGALRRLALTATLVLAAAGPLAGCTTTQHEAQRVQLDSARERAAQLVTKVETQSAVVHASAVDTVAANGKTAFIVTVANSGRRAVSDLPILVGYTLPAGSRVYLNDQAGLNYFQAHLPAIFPGHPHVWIYTVRRSLPAGARPFAEVGAKPSVGARTDEHVSLQASFARSGGVLHLKLDNPTSVPQYQLQVYAFARSGDRYVAAGNQTVTDLGAGSQQKLTLPLVGQPDGGRIQLDVVPTILQ